MTCFNWVLYVNMANVVRLNVAAPFPFPNSFSRVVSKRSFILHRKLICGTEIETAAAVFIEKKSEKNVEIKNASKTPSFFRFLEKYTKKQQKGWFATYSGVYWKTTLGRMNDVQHNNKKCCSQHKSNQCNDSIDRCLWMTLIIGVYVRTSNNGYLKGY